MKTSFNLLLLLGLFSFAVAETVVSADANARGLRRKRKGKGSKKSKGRSSLEEEELEEATASILDIASSTDFLSTLTALVLASEPALTALSTDGPFTVFAPTDEAFAEFIAANPGADVDDVLLYHVLPGVIPSFDLFTGFETAANGESVSVKRSRGRRDLIDRLTLQPGTQDVEFIAVDIPATNGVVHVIGQVLVPPSETIAEIAGPVDDLSTLVSALDATGLLPLFQDPAQGPFTVFAPLDSAFEALGEDVLNALNAETDLATLINILLYHVVVGEVIGKGDLKSLDSITMGNGDDVTVSNRGNALNGSRRFVANDILANNGVVHIIDEVLLPPNLVIP